MTPKQKKRLTQFHDEYRVAEARLQMAIQTLRGAQEQVTATRSRFESVVEFVGGSDATWTHSPEDGVVVLEATKGPPLGAAAQNGAGMPVRHHDREQRRRAKKSAR